MLPRGPTAGISLVSAGRYRTPSHVAETARYARYVLFLLFMANAFNFADRAILAAVQEQLRVEFRLSDFQLGLLGGPAFAICYTFMGFPFARWADRGNRGTVISVSITVWSAMTALCGTATSYAYLLLTRIGVSIGEAGCAPPSHSLISDYFPRERRATAMSIYAVGAPVGMLVSAIVGGYIADGWGWRYAVAFFGILGLGFALLVKLTLRDPRDNAPDTETRPRFVAAIRMLISKRSFIHICVGAAAASMTGNFIFQYLTSFLMRTHDFELARAAAIAGAGGAGGAALGTYLSGVVADRWGRTNPRAIVQVPVIGMIIAAACYWVAFNTTIIPLVIIFILLAPAFQNSYMGQSIAVVQGVAPRPTRATAAALFVFANSLIGYGLGPPLFGLLSDIFAATGMDSVGIDPATCQAQPMLDACAVAQAQGLRWSLLASTVLLFWSAIHYALSARNLIDDLAD